MTRSKESKLYIPLNKFSPAMKESQRRKDNRTKTGSTLYEQAVLKKF